MRPLPDDKPLNCPEPAVGSQRRSLVLGAAAAAVSAWLPTASRAQAAWPSKPVRVIVPFPPGGLTDAYARAYSDHLSRKFGPQFVIENKTGAGGTLGVNEVATRVRQFAPLKRRFLLQKQAFALDPQIFCGGTFRMLKRHISSVMSCDTVAACL